MDSDVVKTFNSELVSLYELRPPVSKKKIVDITKAAMKAIKYYKHVVFAVEKFLSRCKPEYKIPGLYCIDSIIRQSRHQFKDKDVFAPRFAINMQTTLANLLACKAEDKLKVVRVLNLWKSHDIFDESHVVPWLQYCRENHGLETDLSIVERTVKGDQADMSIYNRQQSKIDKSKTSEDSPINDKNEVRGHTPPIPGELSDDPVEGGISQKETLAMMATMGLDLGGMFSSDPTLLKKIHKIVNDKLAERREIDSRRQGNIKNLLSREFDYSDEEESGEDDDSKKMLMESRPAELTKQQIMGMAEAVLREPDTKEEIQRIHTERLSALAQSAAARVQAAQTAAAAAALSSASIPLPQPQLVAAPVPIPLNQIGPATDIPTPVQPPSHMLLSPRAAHQLLVNAPAPGIPSFAPNMPPPNYGVPPPQALLQPQNQMDIDQMQDDRMRRNENRYDRDRRDRERERRDDRRRDRSRDRNRSDTRDYGDSRSSKRSRKSRSRERGSGDRRERSGDRRVPSRGRDRDNPVFREMERQRRKMGLPWPPKEGHVLIASCTLWLGRIPASCSEEDIRASVLEAGEPARITIINSRACAYVTMKDRKSAFRVMDRLQRNIQVLKKSVKLNWGTGQGLKDEKYMDYWDSNRGISLIPYNKLPDDLEPLLEGGYLDVETLPPHLVGLYDEHGPKNKKKSEPAVAQTGTTEVKQPLAMPPFPFPVNQPPPLGGPSFFPPPMMPLPGAFPSGLPPAMGVVPPPGISTTAPQPASQDGNATTPATTAAPSSALAQQQIMALAGLNSTTRPRMPGVPGAASFVQPNFSTPPPNRFPGAPAGFRGAQPNFRSSRPSLLGRGGFDNNFRGRAPFSGGQFPMVGAPPSNFFPPGMVPPFGVPPPQPSLKPDSDDHRTSVGETSDSSLPPHVSVHSNLTTIIPVDNVEGPDKGNALPTSSVDDSTDEPVTSTTFDDDASEKPFADIKHERISSDTEDLKPDVQSDDAVNGQAIE